MNKQKKYIDNNLYIYYSVRIVKVRFYFILFSIFDRIMVQYDITCHSHSQTVTQLYVMIESSRKF